MKNPFSTLFTRRKEITTDPDNLLYQQMFDMISANLVVWAGRDYRDFIKKGYAYNDLVYSIVRLQQDVAKSVNWLTYRVIDEKALRNYKYALKEARTAGTTVKALEKASYYRTKALEEVENGPAHMLLQRPNSHQSINEIIEEYIGWINLMGNFFLYGLKRDDKLGTIRSVHVSPAHMTEIVGGTWMEPVKGYKLKNWMKEEIPASEIMHIKNWNPDFDEAGRQLYGLSPLEAGARILTLDNLGIDTSASSFHNSGVRGILHRASTKGELQPNMTPEQAEQLKKKVEEWTGTSKTNSLAATNAAIAYTEIGKSPVDLGVLQAMDKNVVRLCNIFQTPVELFLPGATFSNKAEARKHLVTAAILPKLDIFKERFNRFAIEPLNTARDKYVVDYDLFSITELQDDLKNIMGMLENSTFITTNEKRAAADYGEFDNALANDLFVNPMSMPMSATNYDTSIEQIDKELKSLKSEVY